MSYVTKLGAYGLAVTAAFAVALAVLLSVSSTPTAEAATASPATVAPGGTVTVSEDDFDADEWGKFTISNLSVATGSFVSGGGQELLCQDKTTTTTCDTDEAAGDIGVKIKVADDSKDGPLIVTVVGVGNDTTSSTIVITVSSDGIVTAVSAKPASTAAPAASGGSTTDVTFTAKNAKNNGVVGKTVTVVTTNGTMTSTHVSGSNTCDASQACTLQTQADDSGTTAVDEAGTVTVMLDGSNRPGDAVLTFTLGTMTTTATVTFYGDAKAVAVDAEQGSVEIGGSTFVVVTVSDSAGNPVAGHPIATGDIKVTGPAVASTPVITGIGYAKDVAGTANDLPACGADNINTTAAGDGTTNAAGKCVIRVFAGEKGTDPDGAPLTNPVVSGSNPLTAPAASATRGEHSIEVSVGGKKATAMVSVAGAPASISTDAPDSVEPLSQTEITVTITDDEGVAAGATEVKVTKVDGSGIIEDAGTDNKEDTVDGVSKFTYFAGSAEGPVTIVVDAGKVREVITLSVATPAPPVPPAPEPGDGTLSGSGALRIFSGGSVEVLAAAAMDACPGGAVLWMQGADGAWLSYGTNRPAFVNLAFAAAFADGLGQVAIFVSACDSGAMAGEDDGPSMESDG